MAGIFQCARDPTPRAFVLAARLARGWLVATTCSAGGPDGKCRSPIAIAPAILRHAPIRSVRDSPHPSFLRRSPCPLKKTAASAPSLFSEMQWRSIGPYRASRTRAAAGHRSQPFTFYTGAVNGGVWKTTDAGARGRRSSTISRPARSATVAVAPSDAEHRSTSAAAKGCTGRISRPATASTSRPTPGKTWTHLGLRDAQQIPRDRGRSAQRRIACSSRRSGIPYGPNEERGIYRSTDGGADVPEGPLEGREHRRQRRRHRSVESRHRLRDAVGRAAGTVGERGVGRHQRRHLQVHRRRHDLDATDEGPARRSSRPTSRSRRQTRSASTRSSPAYDEPGASANRGASGIYRSDDAGESWTQITTDSRPAGRIGGGDLPVPDSASRRIRTPSSSPALSRGSPPTAARRGCRSRARRAARTTRTAGSIPTTPTSSCSRPIRARSITLNGGETWSSWYNQPTAQLYHVTADNAFPYRVCSGQQESGSVVHREPRQLRRDHRSRLAAGRRRRVRLRRARSARSRHRLRRPKVTRFDRRTGQTSGVGPVGGRGGVGGAPGNFRQVRTMPVVFSRGRPDVAVLRQQHAVEDDRRRAELEADQPGPDARRPTRSPKSDRQVPRPGDARSRRSAASSTPWRRPTRTSIASGPAPTTA